MNKILALTRKSIPYCPWLRPIAGTMSACIIMQQLDFWFEKFPDGFYKFMAAAPNNEKYKQGDSWAEELGCSVDEFRSAFDRIGTRYGSKTEFDTAEEKFQGRFYCSYYDKRRGVTWYYRNHALTDAALDELAGVSSGDGKANLQRLGNPIRINGDPHTKDSSETTTYITPIESLNVSAPSTTNGNDLAYMRQRAVDAAVSVTGDAKSRRRFAQLFGICEESGNMAEWDAALDAMRRRLRDTDSPVERPGAYFGKLLADRLLERGVSVPVGSKAEREVVARAVRESLG